VGSDYKDRYYNFKSRIGGREEVITVLKHFLNFKDSTYTHQKWLKGITLIVLIFFAAMIYISLLPMGILGIIISTIIFVIVASICIVIYGVIETVLTSRADKKTHIREKEEFRAGGSEELAGLEETRFKIVKMNKQMVVTGILMAVTFFVALIAAYVFTESQAAAWAIAIASAIPFLIILKAIYNKKSPMDKEYKDGFEKSVVNKTLEAVFDIKEFDREKRIGEKIIHESNLFSYYEEYYGEDYLSAEYKGRGFEQCDVRLTKEEEESYREDDGTVGTRMVTVNVFAGRFIIVDYDAISNEPVYVYHRRGKKDISVVETELQSFNDKFYIKAESPQSALRILTPQVLEGIVTASDKLNCPMSMAFRDDKIYIAVYSDNSFLITNLRGETVAKQQERIKRDVQIILDLIDSIYLK